MSKDKGFVKGDYVVSGNEDVILLYPNSLTTGIRISTKSFAKINNFSECDKFRYATIEEIEWLDECIRAGKFVKKPANKIGKWSKGTFAVVVKESLSFSLKLGFIYEILDGNEDYVEFKEFHSYKPNNLSYAGDIEFRWFATKEEAEAFAKTLEKVEDKFIVGQWYKLGVWISKFKEIKREYGFYGEHINTQSKFYDKNGWLDLRDYNPQLITDLSEIQEFLPDGHTDKCSINKTKSKNKTGDNNEIVIPEIIRTKSAVNFTVSSSLTELSVNIPTTREIKKVSVINNELHNLNCNI